MAEGAHGASDMLNEQMQQMNLKDGNADGQSGNASGNNQPAMQGGSRRPRGRGGYNGPAYGMGHAGMGAPNMRGFMPGFRGGRGGGPRMPMGMFPPHGAMHPLQHQQPHQAHHQQQHHQQQQQQQQPQEISTTNVYLKGLRADTTDQFLRDLCKQYGPIKSAKAIIDRATQQCRGYGFVMFEQPEAAQAALAGLQAAGYQVDFAKVTNNERAHRPEQDPTNLYFSNLPPAFSEENLTALLQPIGEVGSCRILRDYYTGVSRGVGFARMATTALCDRIIHEFNGKMLEGSTEPLQVKFADNPRNKTKQFVGGARGAANNTGAFNIRAIGQYNMLYPGMLQPMSYSDGSAGPRGNRMPGAIPPVQLTTPFSPSFQTGPATPMFMAQPQFVVSTVPFAVADATDASDRAGEEYYMYQAQ